MLMVEPTTAKAPPAGEMLLAEWLEPFGVAHFFDRYWAQEMWSEARASAPCGLALPALTAD